MEFIISRVSPITDRTITTLANGWPLTDIVADICQYVGQIYQQTEILVKP